MVLFDGKNIWSIPSLGTRTHTNPYITKVHKIVNERCRKVRYNAAHPKEKALSGEKLPDMSHFNHVDPAMAAFVEEITLPGRPGNRVQIRVADVQEIWQAGISGETHLTYQMAGSGMSRHTQTPATFGTNSAVPTAAASSLPVSILGAPAAGVFAPAGGGGTGAFQPNPALATDFVLKMEVRLSGPMYEDFHRCAGSLPTSALQQGTSFPSKDSKWHELMKRTQRS
uniref:Uncharacterized protein n=1 Tax=Branchiostoma floridae TaxID=7739 RepID=C3Y8P3_BRAFL|eukprot:XP_002607470.1 hypothetical protein BRAFLDRAFT_69902 [Branchiostoma floridae]